MAILIHSSLREIVTNVICISDRVMAVDLQLNDSEFRLISAYVLHAAYEWNLLESVMGEISGLVFGA